MTEAKPQPNPWCDSLPGQLRAWDSTSLRSYMTCPRRFQYEIIEGWRLDGGLHTHWGSLYHAAVEEFDKAIAGGMAKEEALELAFGWLLQHSGDYEPEEASDPAVRFLGAPEHVKWKPWDAEYVSVWRCTDPGPEFKSGPRKGEPNPAKRCINAKQDRTGHAPDECPVCGKPVVAERKWLYGDEAKNRHTLLRALVWYVDEQPEEGGVRPYVFPDGRPAVELSFQLPLPLENPDGQPYLLCGHLDGLYQFGEEVGPRERKTTGKSLGSYYFDRYSPDVQIDTYDLATSVLFPDLAMRSVMLEATQTAVGFARFHRHFIHSTEGRRQEHLNELLYWIRRAEADARAGYWPKNEAACYSHGGCPFRDICNKDPSVRERYLKAQFVKRHWNPLEER